MAGSRTPGWRLTGVHSRAVLAFIAAPLGWRLTLLTTGRISGVKPQHGSACVCHHRPPLHATRDISLIRQLYTALYTLPQRLLIVFNLCYVYAHAQMVFPGGLSARKAGTNRPSTELMLAMFCILCFVFIWWTVDATDATESVVSAYHFLSRHLVSQRVKMLTVDARLRSISNRPTSRFCPRPKTPQMPPSMASLRNLHLPQLLRQLRPLTLQWPS